MINMCDGCQANLKIKDGLHISNSGLPFMVCQKSRYKMYAVQTDKRKEGRPLYRIGNMEELRAWFNDDIVFEVAIDNHWLKPVEYINNEWRLI